MHTFVMLTRLSPGATRSPRALEDIETEVMNVIRKECDGVEWAQSFSVLGWCDYVDIFRAPDIESAAKVATIIRTVGNAHAEVWAATEWQRFKELIRDMDTERPMAQPASATESEPAAMHGSPGPQAAQAGATQSGVAQGRKAS